MAGRGNRRHLAQRFGSTRDRGQPCEDVLFATGHPFVFGGSLAPRLPWRHQGPSRGLWRDEAGLALNLSGMAAARRPGPGISRSAGGERLQGMGIKQPFEKIVDDHGATVLRACRVLLDGPDADDAWSETFLAALRAYPSLPETANVEAWLVTIAHRKAIDVLRARRRHPVPVGELPGSSRPLKARDCLMSHTG